MGVHKPDLSAQKDKLDLAFSNEAVGDVWELNLAMKNILRDKIKR